MKIAGGVVGFIVLLALALATVIADSAPSTAPSASSLAPMPDAFRALYYAADATCPGLPVEVLMAIGEVESAHGGNDGPSSAGAVGPMQFLVTTFATVAEPVPPGGADPPTPWDPVDAIYGAARLLCRDGGANPATLPGALYAYNHDDNYVNEVLEVAAIYTLSDLVTATASASPP